MSADRIDTLFLLQGCQSEPPARWKARAIRCNQGDAPQPADVRSSRRKHHRPMLAVVVRGVGTAFEDPSARRREETRLRNAVLHGRFRLYDLLNHQRLPATALPVLLEMQASWRPTSIITDGCAGRDCRQKGQGEGGWGDFRQQPLTHAAIR